MADFGKHKVLSKCFYEAYGMDFMYCVNKEIICVKSVKVYMG